jgi:hypothetical protein
MYLLPEHGVGHGLGLGRIGERSAGLELGACNGKDRTGLRSAGYTQALSDRSQIGTLQRSPFKQ